MNIQFRFFGLGWANFTFRTEDEELVIAASYLSDALGSLCDAILELVEGEARSRFVMLDEPGQYRGICTMRPDGLVSLRIIKLWEMEAEHPDDRGDCVFDAITPLVELAGALYAAMTWILEKHGKDGYDRAWGRSMFPMKEYVQLKKWVMAT